LDETPLAFVSSSRGSLTARQNYDREQQLKAELRNSGFGYVRINGHYIEDHNGEKMNVSERSFIVIGNPDDDGQLKAFALRMGEMFDQDSILYKPAGARQQATLIGTTHRDSWLSYGSTQDVGVFHPSRVGDFYSRFKNKTFVFDNVSEQTNLMGRAAHRKKLMKEERQ